ncbi:GGDEF domain-containing protein [Aquabacterium sp.]|uniref:GGDEF domain-containing protein n=1 Tax=Aquabacterium sp. TaxID=1872578 RepID=UPI003D6D6077
MSTLSATTPVKPGSRDTSRSFWKLMYQVSLVAGVTHLLFAGVFYWLDATTMAWVNLGSVTLFTVSYGCLKMRRNMLAAILIVSEVLIHAALAVRSIGWDSGFHYYLLVMVPVVVISSMRRRSSKYLLSGLVFVLYVALDLTMHQLRPLHELSAEVLSTLRAFNLAATFALLFYLSNLYMKLVSKAEKQLRILATTDPLTKLLNRRSLLEVADYELTQRKRHLAPLAFVLADIDHFKSINDQHGHAVGDAVLKSVSQVLSQAVREQDSVARWGGEEFLILMPNATLQAATMVAERLREKVSEVEVFVDSKCIKVSMTFGVSSHRLEEPVDAPVNRADSALYQGKARGRNQVVAEVV